MHTNIIYLFFVILAVNHCVAKDYRNYTLYRAVPVNESHIEFFSKLKDLYDVIFWTEPTKVNKATDFIINPINQQDLLYDVKRHNIYLTTILEDVQAAFDEQTVKNYIRTDKDTFGWNNFFRLNDIYNWLRDMAELYPDEVKIQSIGKSHENRDILAVSIALKGSMSPTSRIIIEGGIHGREWISPAFVTFLIHRILHAKFTKNKLLEEVANSYEWHFVPVLNVDGYEYSHTTDRMWRKNRNHWGVDLNRNFGHAFGTEGISKNKRSEIYCGKKAFSEKESSAMKTFVESKSKNLKYYISFHAYGQYMIIPYTNTAEHLENFEEVYKMCERASKKIEVKYGTRYTYGTAFETVGYKTSGSSNCWVKKTFKVPYVVIFELSDKGKYGFALPPSMILPICEETMRGVIELFHTKQMNFHGLARSVTRGEFNISGGILLIFYGILFIIAF